MRPRFPLEFWADRGGAEADLPHFDRSPGFCSDADPSRFSTSHEGRPCDANRGSSLLDSGKPLSVCIPDHYEPNYPYPLLIWLHRAGSSERELTTLMPQISTRNYFGISFRGTSAADDVLPGGFRWSQSEQDIVAFERELHETVCRFRREFHIHSERIYLAGFDDGATTALRVVLRRPEWFAGVIALSGLFPAAQKPLSRYRHLQGKRVLVGTGSRDRRVSVTDVVHTSRLLHAAGMDVTTRVYDACHEVTAKMLDHVNHWVMDGVLSANVV